MSVNKKDDSFVLSIESALATSRTDKGASEDVSSLYKGLSTESNTAVAAGNLTDSLEASETRIRLAIESVSQDVDVSQEAIKLAAGAGILAASGSTEAATITAPATSKNTLVIKDGMGTDLPAHSLEVFDNKDPAKTINFAETFNLAAGSGRSVSNGIFPIVAIAPTDAGVVQQAELLYTHTNQTRDITGDPIEYFKSKRNVIRAAIDPSIIDLDETALIPVVRPENAAKFVDDAIVPHTVPDIANEAFSDLLTGAIVGNDEVDLIGLSQTDTLIASGQMDSTDAIDRDMRLGTLFFKIDDDVFAVDLAGIPSAAFLPASFEEQHMLHLNLDTTAITLVPTSQRVDNTDFAGVLSYAKAQTGKIRLRVRGSGRCNTQSGSTFVSVTGVDLIEMKMTNGTSVAKDDQAYIDVDAKVKTFEYLGWFPDGKRSNTNLRNEGLIVDSVVMNEINEAGYKAPLTILRPINKEKNQNDLVNLLRLTKTHMDNDAIDTLKYMHNVTSTFGNQDADGERPDLAGIGRHYINPFAVTESVDVKTDIINSIESGKRIKDVAAALLDVYRDVALALYVGSEYGAALDFLDSGVSINGPRVKAKIVADQRIIAILSSANLSDNMFEYELYPSSRTDMKRTSFVTLCPKSAENNPTHPLQPGYTQMAPSVILDGRMTRNGRHTNALMSIPRHRKVISALVIAKVDVENIQDAYRKVV